MRSFSQIQADGEGTVLTQDLSISDLAQWDDTPNPFIPDPNQNPVFATNQDSGIDTTDSIVSNQNNSLLTNSPNNIQNENIQVDPVTEDTDAPLIIPDNMPEIKNNATPYDTSNIETTNSPKQNAANVQSQPAIPTSIFVFGAIIIVYLLFFSEGKKKV